MRRILTVPLAIMVCGFATLSPLTVAPSNAAETEVRPSAAVEPAREADGPTGASARAKPDQTAQPAPSSRAQGALRPQEQTGVFGAMRNWSIPSGTEIQIPGATPDLQCVPFARHVSGIEIYGDARTWWDKAAGIFARGNRPEPGAVLSFSGIDRMPNGHVAVVHRIVGARKILIDHANWPTATVRHGAISRDILVEDVSLANDWTEVRVQFGQGGPLGSVYPTNGFIYGWSESGAQIAKPRLALDGGFGGPRDPRLRPFNSIAYFWALPPADRRKAFAAVGLVPAGAGSPHGSGSMLASDAGKPLRLLGPGLMTITGSGLVRTTGFTQLELGTAGGSRPAQRRFVVQ